MIDCISMLNKTEAVRQFESELVSYFTEKEEPLRLRDTLKLSGLRKKMSRACRAKFDARVHEALTSVLE